MISKEDTNILQELLAKEKVKLGSRKFSDVFSISEKESQVIETMAFGHHIPMQFFTLTAV